MRYTIQIHPSREVGDDRARVVVGAGWLLACVADGAGGTGGGARAAQDVVDELSRFQGRAPPGERDLLRCLLALDTRLSTTGGQTTAAIAVVTEFLVYGVSVGDSEILYLASDSIERLTSRQQRKPLLGSGQAKVTGFGSVAQPGARLLLATDGLFTFAPRAVIEQTLRAADFDAIAPRLVQAAQLPTGALSDDVAVVVVELP